MSMKPKHTITHTHELLADLQGCKFDLRAKQSLRVAVKKLLVHHAVRVLKSAAQQFPNDGLTLIYILADSHIAIHTWPEKSLVNVDLFLCNYTRNNNQKAKAVLQGLIELLNPTKVKLHKITRLN